MGYTDTEIVTEARRLLNEPAEGFWLNTDLQAWRTQAVLDLSTKARCVEVSVPISFPVAGVQTIPTGLIGVEALLRANGQALAKLRPRQFGDLGAAVTAQDPTSYAQFATSLFVFPRPDSPVTLTLLYWKSSTTWTDLPETYHELALIFIVALAKLKEEKYTVAAQLLDLYVQALQYQRQDLQDRQPDSKEMLRMADRIVTSG
jgi:hypothetical protein